VTYSYVDRSLRPGAEGHGISLLLAQQIKLVHNWIEGQSIGHLCGGFAGAIPIANFVTCQDVEDRGNRYTYPYSWMLAWQAGFKPNGGTNGYVRKNAHEYKFGDRVLEDGNIYENVDGSGAQNGTVFSHKTAQQSAATGTNYWTTLDNVTVTNVIGRNACNGPSFGDRSENTAGNGGGVSLPAQFFLVQNDLWYNLSINGPGCTGISPQYGFRIGSAAPSTTWAVTPLRDGAGLTTALTLTGAAGNGVSDFSLGDPVTVTGCSDTSFNVGNTVMGPPALAGTLTNGLTVVYSNPGTASAGAGVTGCTLANAQGWPNGLTFQHITSIDDTSTSNPSNSANGAANIWPLARNFSVTNSVLINGGLNSTSGEGTRTSVRMFDPSTEVLNNDLIPGRSGISCPGFTGASCYTEYGGPHAGASPPVTLYLTPAGPCAGNDPVTGNCAGVFAAMSTGNFPITISDWHNYRLCHAADAACNNKASLYAAGQSDQATDGTDLGINPAALDAAQTSAQYGCGTACGFGPYADTVLSPSPFFGFSESNTNGSNWPTVTYGMQRYWDSPPNQWPSINTAAGVFTWGALDSNLALAFSKGALESMYTLARTPPWITSQPADTTCNYQSPAVGGGHGECFPPSDLNADGSGTNATWKAWITAIATHVNDPTYLLTHSHIRYWEIWNEPDAAQFWSGSFAQLARLTEDANCIITGRGVIHQSGNGSATACAATAIDPTAVMVMSSGHASSAAVLTYAQNQLYCNNTGGIPAFQLPCPNPANATAAALDVLNYHMKPGNAYPTLSLEAAMTGYLAGVRGTLQTAELAKPIWNGEAQYSTTGYVTPYTDPDMAASVPPRFYLISWSLGITGNAWYTAANDPASAVVSAQQTYNWLTGSSLSTPCGATGTVYSCGFTHGGNSYLAMWDTAQSCSGGSCTTANQTVAAQWTHYQDMTSASSPSAISGNSVPVGIKAVVLSH
jgi:hypothetical protein